MADVTTQPGFKEDRSPKPPTHVDPTPEAIMVYGLTELYAVSKGEGVHGNPHSLDIAVRVSDIPDKYNGKLIAVFKFECLKVLDVQRKLIPLEACNGKTGTDEGNEGHS